MLASVAGVLSLLGLDMLWLRFYMVSRYERMVNDIQGTDIVLTYEAAAVAYLCMVYGLLHFVMGPLHQSAPNCNTYPALFYAAAMQGFPFGVTLYGVYNGTCAAVFTNWDTSIAVVDTLWGGTVYTLAAFAGLLASCHSNQ